MAAAGDAAAIDRETIHRLGATIERRLGGRNVERLAIWVGALPAALGGDASAVVELLVRGIVEGHYDPKGIYLDKVEFGAAEARRADRRRSRRRRGGAGRGRRARPDHGRGRQRGPHARQPGVERRQPRGARRRRQRHRQAHGLWIDVIDADRAAKLGMGMFLAVGRGSDNPPRMIVMRSGKKGETDRLGRHLAIVGKGVCFDSGGISIKPSDRMEEMKMDKTGAATVIAAIETVARLAPGTPLLAIAPAVENMPGPHSTRPGDVVKALNGKIGRHHEHRRRRPADPRRRPDLRGAARRDPPRRRGHPDRAVARALGHLVTGAFGTPQAWFDEVARGRGQSRRALLADPARRRLRRRHGQLVRRPPERRLGRRLAGQERAVHP